MRAKYVMLGAGVMAIGAGMISRLPAMGIGRPRPGVTVPLGRTANAGPFEVPLATLGGPAHVGRNTFVALMQNKNRIGGSDSRLTLVLSQPPGSAPSVVVPMDFDFGGFKGEVKLDRTGPWEADLYITEPMWTRVFGLDRVFHYSGAAAYTFTVDH
jgi:hypothetical protein